MKTGSFVFQRVLDSQVCKKVGGGVSPNFNYQPPQQNYASINISANGGSGPHYQYQVTTNLAISNVIISGSLVGNDARIVTGGNINLQVGGQ